jgi:hypothetical protein
MVSVNHFDLVFLCGKKFAGKRPAEVVIALKRNGAYAEDIQVPQLGSRRAV